MLKRGVDVGPLYVSGNSLRRLPPAPIESLVSTRWEVNRFELFGEPIRFGLCQSIYLANRSSRSSLADLRLAELASIAECCMRVLGGLMLLLCADEILFEFRFGL